MTDIASKTATVAMPVMRSVPLVGDEPAMRDWAAELVDRARREGVELTGNDGLLTALVRQVLQTGLEVEMTAHRRLISHQRDHRRQRMVARQRHRRRRLRRHRIVILSSPRHTTADPQITLHLHTPSDSPQGPGRSVRHERRWRDVRLWCPCRRRPDTR